MVKTQEGILIDINQQDAFIWGEVTNSLNSYKGPLNTVLDIGAHVGCFSLYAAFLGAKQVIAIEALPHNYVKLTRNTLYNKYFGTITPLLYAVWRDSWEVIPIRHGGTDVQFSLVYREEYPEIQVQTISFKELLQNTGKVDYLKMDIEGGEFEILERSPEMSSLLQEVGYVDIEIHQPTNVNYFSPDKFTEENSLYSSAEEADKEMLEFLRVSGFEDADFVSNAATTWIRGFNSRYVPD